MNPCPACSQSFEYERHLIQHLMNAHGWTVEQVQRLLDMVESKREKGETKAGE